MTTLLTIPIVSLAVLFLAGGVAAAECIKAPAMTWSDACLKACDTPAKYNLCQETLLHAPDAVKATVTVYALAAAKRAMESYGATLSQANGLLHGGGGGGASLPGVERAAYLQCVGYYTEAQSRMAVVAGDLSADCVIEQTRLEYSKSVVAMENCGSKLMAFKDSPLVAMNAADYDLTQLVLELGALIGGSLP